MRDGNPELDALPHPFAVAGDASMGRVHHVHLLDGFPSTLLGLALTLAVQTEERRDQTESCRTLGERIELRTVANGFIEPLRIVASNAQNGNFTARRPEQS